MKLIFILTTILLQNKLGYAGTNIDIQAFAKTLPKDIPSPTQFLELLFNATLSDVIQIAKVFDFLKEVKSDEIHCLIYQRNGKYKTVRLDEERPDIDDSKPIKVIIHGWQSTGEEKWVKNIANSYHKAGITNVLAIDWKYYSKQNYLGAATATKKVGELTGTFLYNVIKKDKTKLKNIHIIGHSLGAHVAGFAGDKIQGLSNGEKVDKITGLDVAAPLFEFPIKVPSYARLNEQNANFVEAIHTNIGFLGFFDGLGHQDFFIDFGGPVQAGCLKPIILDSFFCSHSKSHDIYDATILSTKFVTTNCGGPLLVLLGKCDSNPTVIMGEHNNNTEITGDFYISVTKENKPVSDNTLRPIIPGLPIIG